MDHDHHPYQTAWSGYYMQAGQRTDMEFDSIIIQGSSLTGSGTDTISPFTLEGTVVAGEVKFVKQYTGTASHFICYKGELSSVEAGEQIVGYYYFDKEFEQKGDRFELNRSYEVEKRREAAFKSVVSRMKCVVGSVRFVFEDALQGAVQVAFIVEGLEADNISADTFHFTCFSVGAGLVVSLAGPIFECYLERKLKQLAGPVADSPPEVDAGNNRDGPGSGYERVQESDDKASKSSREIRNIRARVPDESTDDYYEDMVEPMMREMTGLGYVLCKVNGKGSDEEAIDVQATEDYMIKLIENGSPSLELEFIPDLKSTTSIITQRDAKFQERVRRARELHLKHFASGNTELVEVLMEKPAFPAEVVDIAITDVLGGFNKRCILAVCSSMYWSYVLTFPAMFPITCGKGVHIKAHLVFCLIAFMSLSVEVWAAAHTKLGYLMLIHAPQQYAFSMGLSTLARFDAYSDMAFIFMARDCGSWLWQPAALIFAIGVIGFQMLPGLALLVSGRYMPAALKLTEFNALLMLLKPRRQ